LVESPPAAATADELEANVFPTLLCAAMYQCELSRSDTWAAYPGTVASRFNQWQAREATWDWRLPPRPMCTAGPVYLGNAWPPQFCLFPLLVKPYLTNGGITGWQQASAAVFFLGAKVSKQRIANAKFLLCICLKQFKVASSNISA
jgi:hypothetical protein